ncbi:NAD(P)/FAD-dependent oxidoreductase [Amycolatopsis saalfeldensis]|uniref:Glycine/D-amino acid oxidase n=1 Tax=Amycolatopsis saalfeldensis TaxID=394193 RepID=A0A1H8U4Q1_9PSEU|nr:FAD-binding oxidoreductase [Amycolatopsis saalfeldensis]SEO97803.1 Glycine/D-amino acid oxidase [Amycolatopsis saalfeldensis]
MPGAPIRDLVVVGAGVVGASVAYHAARAGAAVTLVDAGRPGSGVTVNSFAWIGSSGVRTGPAAGLRVAATDEYHRLEAELPGLPVTWSGSLSWRTGGSTPEAGPGQKIIDAATLEPHLRHPPDWAVWAPGDGAVDPVGVTERLIAGARAHGARIHPDVPVTAIRRDAAGRIAGVETAAGPLSAATVVLAAGVATAALAAPLGIAVPVAPSPATLFRFRAPAGLVRTVVNTEDFDLRQVAADRVIAAADSPDRTLAAIRSTFRGTRNVKLLSAHVGARPMPADGEPVIGPVAEVPGLYLAVMHAAVTLAPAVGRLAARELVDRTVEPALAGCRLDRFQPSRPPSGGSVHDPAMFTSEKRR